jgi:hypothetical protein
MPDEKLKNEINPSTLTSKAFAGKPQIRGRPEKR